MEREREESEEIWREGEMREEYILCPGNDLTSHDMIMIPS